VSQIDPDYDHNAFLEDKDEQIGRYWLDPEDYRAVDETRSDVAVAVAASIFFILGVGIVFYGIMWLASHTPK